MHEPSPKETGLGTQSVPGPVEAPLVAGEPLRALAPALSLLDHAQRARAGLAAADAR